MVSLSSAIALVGAATCLQSAQAMPSYLKKIPNGDAFGEYLGHTPTQYPNTDFGTMFLYADNDWSKICTKDFPGTTIKNGEAFGDPCCVWKTGDKPAFSVKAFKGVDKDGNTILGKPTSKTVCASSVVQSTTKAPVATTKAPVYTTKAPVATTKAPEVTTKAPVYTTKAPVATTKAPVATTKAPEVTTKAPVYTTKAPVATTKAPEVTTKAPVYTTKAPVATTKAPEVTTKAPVATTKAPEHATKAPSAYPTKAPVAPATKAPAHHTNAPVVSKAPAHQTGPQPNKYWKNTHTYSNKPWAHGPAKPKAPCPSKRAY